LTKVQPDVAVVDVRLSEDPSAMTGIGVYRDIRSADTGIVNILTSYADDEALYSHHGRGGWPKDGKAHHPDRRWVGRQRHPHPLESREWWSMPAACG
jgi:hypothetical protein